MDTREAVLMDRIEPLFVEATWLCPSCRTWNKDDVRSSGWRPRLENGSVIFPCRCDTCGEHHELILDDT